MLKNKTKEELIDLVNELTEQVGNLEHDIDYWQEQCNDMEEIKNELECHNENFFQNFIWRLKLDGLYTDKLGDFIEEYKKYYND